MLRTPLLMAICLFFCSFSFGQQAVNKGKIFLEGKTLEGFISTSVYDEVPQEFRLSGSEKGPFEKVNGASRVVLDNGTVYEKHFISIPVIRSAYMARQKKEYEEEGTIVSGEFFVQQMVDGHTRLYLFRDNFLMDHFFFQVKNDTGIVYLEYRPFTNEESRFHNDDTYRNQLYVRTQQQSCTEKFGSNALQLEYHLRSMLAFFKKLNSCGTEAAKDQFTEQHKWSLSIGATAGMAYQRMNALREHKKYNQHEFSPAGGLSFLLSPVYNRKGYAFGLDLWYNRHKGQSDRIPESYYSFVSVVTVSGIMARPYFRVYLGDGRIIPCIDLGVFMSHTLSGSESRHYSYNGKLDGRVKYPSGMYSGLGFTMKNAELQFQYGANLRGNYDGMNLLFRYFPFQTK